MLDGNIKLAYDMEISNGGHILYVYENEDRYIENAVSFILSGIKYGHHLLIIENRSRYKNIHDRLSTLLTEEELLYVHHIDNYKFYRIYGDFDCTLILDHFNELLKPFQEKCMTVRTWAHVEWKEQDNILAILKQYEIEADKNVKKLGLISVCAYNANEIRGSFQNDLLRSHAYFMTDNELVPSPLYEKGCDQVVFPSLSIHTEMQNKIERHSLEREKAEGQLRATRAQLESFIMDNLDPILIFNQHDQLIKVNYAFERTYGWSAEEVLGISVTQIPIASPEQEAEVLRNRNIVISGVGVEAYETFSIKKDGTKLHVLLSCSPIRDAQNRVNGFAVIIRDITEKKLAEQLLISSEKQSIAAQLAAGIAHEIRNPITSIKGFLQLLQRSKSTNHDKYFEIMFSEFDRIELIIRELLVLAKPQVTKFELKDIRTIIEDVMTLLEGQAHLNNIQIITIFELEEAYLNCDENQIKQMCINFIKNAIESMPNGGNLTIELKLYGKNQVLIGIADEGFGIPEQILKLLGQPFYTTKEKGTGLGFMVSKKIVENHYGQLRVSSEVNKGTTIEVLLPIAK